MGKPTAAGARRLCRRSRTAGAKGLIPEDYDADAVNGAGGEAAWGRTGRRCRRRVGNADAISLFDVAMTVNAMRYISDLRIGRVNPSHFNFDINVQSKRYDLAEFVSDHAVDETDVPKLIASVEPDSEQYRRDRGGSGQGTSDWQSSRLDRRDLSATAADGDEAGFECGWRAIAEKVPALVDRD